MLRSRRRAFRALVVCFVPEARALDDTGWTEVEAIVTRAMAARPSGLQRQLSALIYVLDVLSLLRYGRPIAALDDRRRTRLLQALSHSPLVLLRRGIWGLRTLVFMGYYARPAAGAEIGYRASPAGWSARTGASA